MMKLFRNPEILRAFLLYLVLTASAVIAAFIMAGSFGWLMLAVCAAFVGIWLVHTARRYRRIAELSADIDRILHGEDHVSLNDYAEGELGILQSEVHKMTIRLREQKQSLVDDKIYLADSLADISHQIRTPLTSINLLVSFLSDPDITDERRGELSRELYSLLSRIDWLITTLLKMSKLDAGTVQFNSETVPMAELIRKSTESVAIPMELRGQELNVTADGNFTGDMAWTSEAITNIVKNCMEHTPEGGIVSVTATDNPLFAEIIISDNGRGIAGEDLPYIFERFYKGKNSADNSFGIGLALARTIITTQNGTIKAENVLPNGAKFTIRFYKGTV